MKEYHYMLTDRNLFRISVLPIFLVLLPSSNLKNGDGSPVECVIADSTIGRVAELLPCGG